MRWTSDIMRLATSQQVVVMGRLGKLRAALGTRHLVILILVAHFVLGTLYSVVIPLWEGHDEWAHYRYIQHLVTERTFPQPGQRLISEQGMMEESFQPPFYYVLGALVTFWIDTSDGLGPVVNPYAFTGTGAGGVNVAVHDPQMEGFPYRGTVLAVHVARLVSVLLGTAAVWATYLTGRLILPHRPQIALGAMAFNAFAPQFLFIGGFVNNDILAAAVSSFVLLLTVRVVVKGARLLDLFLLALGLGLGIASKSTTLALVPVAIAGMILVNVRESGVKGLLAPLLDWGCVIGTLIVVYWLLTRIPWTAQLAARHFNPFQGYLFGVVHRFSQLDELPWHLIPGALRYGFFTFWASFGWGNVGAEVWVYWLFGLLSLAGALGVMLFMFRKSATGLVKALIGLLMLDLLCAIILPAYRELLMQRALIKGRYVLVAMPAVSLLLVLGLTQWVPQRFTRGLIAAVGVGMFVLALITPFRYIRPAYAAPPLLTPADVQHLQNPLHISFGNKAEVLGYDVGQGKVRAGQAIAVTLYWRCLSEMDRNYTVAVKVLGPDYQEYGGVNIYPGRGNFATSLWRAGDIFRETYWVPVSADAPAPCLGRVSVALFDAELPGEYLYALDAEGVPIERDAIFGRLKIKPEEQPEYAIGKPLYFELGDEVALVGYEMDERKERGETLSLKLYWQALSEMDRDYTVFVHFIGQEGQILAQWDSQPREGAYPTSLWDRGEVVRDERELALPEELPAGEYQIAVGMYLLETMQRLPILDGDGNHLPNDQVTLSVIISKGN
jgi:4-amino-4-deoxy-L-arabinose transferase-like glycosyltransferase